VGFRPGLRRCVALPPGDLRWMSPLELRAALDGVTARFPSVNQLPTALAEKYTLIGRRPDPTSNQDRLLLPNELLLDQSGEVLVVRRENQGCAQWDIRVADLNRDDPPVVTQAAGSEHGWRPYADRWSHACIEMVLFESLWTRAELSFDVELDDQTMAMGRRAAVHAPRRSRTAPLDPATSALVRRTRHPAPRRGSHLAVVKGPATTRPSTTLGRRCPSRHAQRQIRAPDSWTRSAAGPRGASP